MASSAILIDSWKLSIFQSTIAELAPKAQLKVASVSAKDGVTLLSVHYENDYFTSVAVAVKEANKRAADPKVLATEVINKAKGIK